MALGARVDDVGNMAESPPVATREEQAAPPEDQRTWKQVETVTRWVSGMKVVRPELVRSIYAYQALYSLGGALHGGQSLRRLQRLHRKSHPTDSIEEFWSHSWQLKPYRKILCLLFLKNGLAASIVGTMAAGVLYAIMYHGYLLEYRPYWNIPYFCMLSGTVFSVLTLFLWPSRAKVFLDVCCIDQVDAEQKAAGIISLGGILKKSKTLLVLWDHTYIDRLWCVFEIAAFLHRSGKPQAIIRPTLLGITAIVAWGAIPVIGGLFTVFHATFGKRGASWGENINVFLIQGVFYLVFYAGTAAMRAYHHSIEVFHRQLDNFKLAETKCGCCSVGHVAPDGSAMACDREIVVRCIRSWFGSEQQFEDFAAPLLRASFDQQLGQHRFPYGYFLVIFCPVLWTGLDMSLGACNPWPCYSGRGTRQMAWRAHWLFYFAGMWLGVMPATAKVGLRLCSIFCRPRRYRVCDVLLNFMIVTAMNLCFALAIQVGGIYNDNEPKWVAEVIEDSYVRSALLCATFILPSVLLFMVPELCRLCRALLRRNSRTEASNV